MGVRQQIVAKYLGEWFDGMYKDYADAKKQKPMTLSHQEFARRFEQHILPKRFVKIRHGGYLAHNGKNQRIAAIHQQLNLPKPMPKIIIP